MSSHAVQVRVPLMSEKIRFYLSSNIWLSHLNAFTKLALAAFISGWQVCEHREHTVPHTTSLC